MRGEKEYIGRSSMALSKYGREMEKGRRWIGLSLFEILTEILKRYSFERNHNSFKIQIIVLIVTMSKKESAKKAYLSSFHPKTS